MTAALYRYPDSLPAELEQLDSITERFRAGDVEPARFQAFRVPQGIYEQRENGTYMLRARLAAGVLLPDQMRAAADVAREFGSGPLHLTSRQDLQVHGVHAENIHEAVLRLTAAGLSTKGGGGNTVRNIAACPQAGVCAEELFDIAPHAIALTEALVADPRSFQLPRKYKIAYSGCGRDCAAATVNDLGFIARVQDGVEGFAVYVGGGMGAKSAVGRLLEPFIPANEAGRVAEAVKRVFDRHGNRKNKHHARLRFLIADLGFETFVDLYRQELEQAALKVNPGPLPVGSRHRPVAPVEPHPEFAAWRAANVIAQKQEGYYSAVIAPALGNLTPDTLAALADIVDAHGEGALRTTNRQGFLLRWLRDEELASLHAELRRAGLAEVLPSFLRDMVTCAGAATCRLGICLSRGLSEAIRQALATGANLSLHISGCPNACGRHPVADIGLYGAARRVRGRLAPYYVIQLGGHVEEGRTTLASGKTLVPARRVPEFLEQFLAAFAASPQHPDFAAFLASGGRQTAESLAAQLDNPPDPESDPDFYTDWDAAAPFTLAGRGQAECGAGVFDLIAIDLTAASDALEAGRLLEAVTAATRALLPTRGEEATGAAEAIDLFQRCFVEQNLVSSEFVPLLENAAATLEAGGAISAEPAAVRRLVLAVRELYESMGPSLRI